ncbi:hypothetical protein RND81_07G081000 [Saponaria officinalis]|uniref:Uncharacterized protein n=1 Tax=Saponaria officinalis TaxID=3572 RepID=A0AAW1JS16_SAPOF
MRLKKAIKPVFASTWDYGFGSKLFYAQEGRTKSRFRVRTFGDCLIGKFETVREESGSLKLAGSVSFYEKILPLGHIVCCYGWECSEDDDISLSRLLELWRVTSVQERFYHHNY